MQRAPFFSRMLSFAATIYVAAGFGVFLSVADNHLRKKGTLPLPPTVAALVFLLSVLAVIITADCLSGRPTTKLSFLIRANISVVSAFFALACLSLVFALHPTAYWGDDRKWIYLQSYDFFIFFCAMLLPGSEFIRIRFRFFVIVGLLTLLGSIWYETSYPGTFSSVAGRASGFPGNSNWGALVSVMICSMALSYRDGAARLLDLILLALTGSALYFTLSRSGLINFMLLVSFYIGIAIWSGKNRARTVLSIGCSAVMLLSFFVLVVPLLSQGSALMAGSKAQNRVLAMLEGEVVDDGSAADRMEAARETLDRIESSPIIGNGTGFNRKMRQTPHNLYLKLWVDSGILGVCTWLILLACAFWLFSARRYRPGQALVLATAFGGFFSHNILEQRTFLILLGTAASMSFFESAGFVQRLSNLTKVYGQPGTVRPLTHPGTLENLISTGALFFIFVFH